MSESENGGKRLLTEAVMLARLNKSDEMREFFIEMWKQNPVLAKQGGVRVKSLLTPVEQVDTESKRGRGGDEENLQSDIDRSVKVRP